MSRHEDWNMERRAFLGAVAAGALVAGAAPARRRRVGSASNAFAWNELAEGRVWVTGGSSTGGNVMLVASEGQAAVVDAKFAGLGPLLRKEAEERAGGAVTALINTHHHGDHTGGNFAFSGGPMMIAHAAAVYRIGKSGDAYRQQVSGAEEAGRRLPDATHASAAIQAFAQAAGSASSADAWVPGRAVNAWPMRHRVGRLDLELYHFGPGHTDNDLVVHVPDLNVVHCGDLFFNGRHPFFDSNGGVSTAGWQRSVRAILDLCDGSTRVIPGHGPLGDRAALRQQLEYLERIYEEVGRAGRAGKPRDEVVAMTWPFMEGLDADNIRGRAVGAVYDELFPSGPE